MPIVAGETRLVEFPDVATVLCDLLAHHGENGTVTPADLQDHLPFQRVTVLGGTDDTLTDTARVDVDTFAGTYADARRIAEQDRQLLISGPHLVGGVVLDRIRTTTRPREIPWADPHVRRFTATYTVSARRHPL